MAIPMKGAHMVGLLLVALLAATTTSVFGQAPASPPSPFLNFRSPEVFNGVPAYWDQTTCAVCEPPAEASVANPRNPVTGYETNCAVRKSNPQDAVLLQSLKYIRNYNVVSRTTYGGYTTGTNVSAPQYYLTTIAGMGDVYAGRNPGYDANPGVHSWFTLRGLRDKATDPYSRDTDISTIVYEELHAWTSMESFISHLLVGQEIAAGLPATILAYNYLFIGPVNQTSRGLMDSVLSFTPGPNFWMTRWRGPATSRPPPSFIGFVFNDVIDYYSLPGSPALPVCNSSLVRLPAEVRTRPVYMWLNATIYPSAVAAYERDMRDLVSQMRRMRCVISFFSQQQPAPGTDDDDIGAFPRYNSELYSIGMFFNSWECMDAAILYPSSTSHRSRVKAVLDKMQNLDIVFFSGQPGNVGVGAERYILRALRQRSSRMGSIRMRSRPRELGWMLNEFIDIDGKRPASWTPPPACVVAFANCSAAPWVDFS